MRCSRYDLTPDEVKNWPRGKTPTHPYLATFSFSPIQELIKASRKMRDFWAGSWILHYLSAKVCWALAWKYGPDCLIYPSLYQQPLIDRWLLGGSGSFQGWEDFHPWIELPNERQLLTAGFPNVIVLVLPKDRVQAAMQLASQTLKAEWLKLGSSVLQELQQRRWMPGLTEDSNTWNGWLDTQWQTYWSASPIGKEGEPLKKSAISKDKEAELQSWLEAQNVSYDLKHKESEKLFQSSELDFIRAAYELRLATGGRKFSVNVGSWWCYAFDQTRLALASSKNARSWEIPTAFSVRSTVSGNGPAVHPGADWMSEGKIKQLWKRHAGLFDGSEQLNATEVIKRSLHKILPNLFGGLDEQKIVAAYPDLTAGVAGYLKASSLEHLEYFHQVCRSIRQELLQQTKVIPEIVESWGITWIDNHENPAYRRYHSRFLNAGWLAQEIVTEQTEEIEERIEREKDAAIVDALNQQLLEIKHIYHQKISIILNKSYPVRNPADWYVIAAGDGDGMSEWLKGKPLKSYADYIPSFLEAPEAVKPEFVQFVAQQKRMGPSTHSALSRALLDFSNQLVPYLTEQRHAGRLIYSGGDDVLAYTNLWDWDKWLWDVRECFKGSDDPGNEFTNDGDYWQWRGERPPENISDRPLFTMGSAATISFGIVVAHHSVPLAIALENLWEAQDKAKEHTSPNSNKKDAVQVRVLYGNGNILSSTTKFDVFGIWKSLPAVESALFERAAQLWEQHPAPREKAIQSWVKALCYRREAFQGDDIAKDNCEQYLSQMLAALWRHTQAPERDLEIQSWLKLAAFVLRQRDIKIGGCL